MHRRLISYNGDMTESTSVAPAAQPAQPETLDRPHVYVWLASTLAFSVVFAVLTIPSLGRYPALSGDDSWIMSASFKLATTGVFGSDLYTGFHDADQHYFIALPVYHLLQALSFLLFGAGIVQARLVTIASALCVLWVTTWLAWRWYGLVASVICGALLLLLRVSIVGLWPGIPLVAVGRTGRYDMTAVAATWLTVACLDALVRAGPPTRRWPAYAVGVCAGLATLTQFFGAFAIVIAAVTLAWWTVPRSVKQTAALRIGIGWAIVVIPYLLYVAAHWSAFRGQATLKTGRTAFLDAHFYLDNLRDEFSRYRYLTDPDLILSVFSSWFFVVAIVPIIVWLSWRARQTGNVGDRLLLTTLTVAAIGLALFDSTNVPLYTIVLWPGCVIALAAAIANVRLALRHHLSPSRPAYQRQIIAVGFGILGAVSLFIINDGVTAYRDDRQTAEAVPAYASVADRLDASIPAGAVVVSHERWWWGLHTHEYLALNMLQRNWEEQSGTFAELFDATGATVLIIDDNARSEIARYPTDLQTQIATLLVARADPAIVIEDRWYGRFEIYILRERHRAGGVARPVRLW